MALLGACQVATITAPGYVASDGGGPPPADPRELFETTVRPLLDRRCASCHTDELTAPRFLGPGDYYDTVLGYTDVPLVVPGDPSTSELIQKGVHDGPAWPAPEAATVAAWIDAEGESGPIEPPPGGTVESMEITVVNGTNRIGLDSIGLPGSAITFLASYVAQGARLTDVQLVAGTGGAAISGPRFVMHAADGTETLDQDRFSTTELRLSAGQSGELISAMLLVGQTMDGTLSVQFAAASQME